MPTYSTIQKNLKAVCMLLLATTILGEASLANRAGGRGKGGGKRFSPKSNSVYGKPKNESDRRRVIEGKEWGTSSRVSSFYKEKIRKPLEPFIGKESTADTETNPYEITPPSTSKEKEQETHIPTKRTAVNTGEIKTYIYNVLEKDILTSTNFNIGNIKKNPEIMFISRLSSNYSYNPLSSKDTKKHRRDSITLSAYIRLYEYIQRQRRTYDIPQLRFLNAITLWKEFEKKSSSELPSMRNVDSRYYLRFLKPEDASRLLGLNVFTLPFDFHIRTLPNTTKEGKIQLIQTLNGLIDRFDLLTALAKEIINGERIAPEMGFSLIITSIQEKHLMSPKSNTDVLTAYMINQAWNLVSAHRMYNIMQMMGQIFPSIALTPDTSETMKSFITERLTPSNINHVSYQKIKEIEDQRNLVRTLLTRRLTEIEMSLSSIRP